MKSTELMIGCLVYLYGVPTRVTPTLLNMMSIDEDSKAVQPIPLTEEILSENGFIIRRDAYYLSCGFLDNDWARSGVEVTFYDRAVIDIECNYFKHTNRVHLIADSVHELQHALRLCGLNELADNFKIV